VVLGARPVNELFGTNVSKMAIRKATRDDALAVLGIRNAAVNSQCVGHYSDDDLKIWTDGELTETFAEAVEKYGYVAISEGLIVATGMVNLESGKIDALFVEPTHMSAGLGKQMLSHLENLAAEAGLTELKLDSTLNAAPFYRAHGFVGDCVAKYESPRGISLACVPMAKVLVSGA
jgi:GNAT superfamily N-acetyltransferase